MPKTQILLATCNSETYLPELLDSFLAQDVSDFDIIVRDDASTDSTLEILEDFRPQFGARLHLLPDRTASGGAIANFVRLVDAASADYILFADHDDVWLPSKVRRTVEGLKEIEARTGPETPAFWFCDAIPADSELVPLADSFWASRRMRPDVTGTLRTSVVCAIANGCMAGVNRALLESARPLPAARIVGHDWYLALAAVCIGQIGWSDEKLMLYRQHQSNVSAISHRTSPLHFLLSSDKRARVRRGLNRRREQAQALLDQFGDRMTARDRKSAELFVRSATQNFLNKRLSLLRGGFLYPDLARNVGMLLHC